MKNLFIIGDHTILVKDKISCITKDRDDKKALKVVFSGEGYYHAHCLSEEECDELFRRLHDFLCGLDEDELEARQKSDALSMPVEKLNLPSSVRMRWMNTFYRLNIKTVADLVETPKTELLKNRSIGKKCFYFLREALMEQCKLEW